MVDVINSQPDSSYTPQGRLENGGRIIAAYVRTLPSTPGVYRMQDEEGKVLYVGKAKNLKKRVESYTHLDRLSNRHKRMVSETARMEFVTTPTEVEALLLEANLIKSLNPRYNILLKDGKFFSYLVLTSHPFPRLTKHRGPRLPEHTYFGPYASAESVNQSLISLYKAFKIRACTDTYFASRKRPCLQYHIKRCWAPCVNLISQEDYQKSVSEAKAFLQGQSGVVQKRLAQRMTEASNRQDYEKAAVFRDQIRVLSSLQAQQTVNTTHIQDADIFGIAQEGEDICFQIFVFRQGSNHGSFSLFPQHTKDMPLDEILESFFSVFYEDKECPPFILLSRPFPTHILVAQALSERAGHKVSFVFPQRGPRVEIVRQAQVNAENSLARYLSHSATRRAILKDLGEILNCSHPLQRIEVYDNSHIQGTDAIGAMIAANADGFDKKSYRKFIIKNSQVWGDDFGMMREVLRRRFSGTLSQDKDTNPVPDLLIIDGGAGQVNAAQEVLDSLDLSIPILGIAKGPHRNAGQETFYRPHSSSFTLEHEPKVLYFLQRVRDEAHRFAIGFHRHKREKRATSSRLDSIPGVGPTRKKMLLKHFGSAKAVMDASVRDLALVEGISEALAQVIYDHFH